MTGSYFSLPSDDAVKTAMLSMTNQTVGAPVSRAQNEDPSDTTVASTTSAVVTITCLSNITPVALSVINTHATSIVLDGAGMLAQPMTIPERTPDDQQVNGWLDLRGVASVTGDTFKLTMSNTGATALEFGPGGACSVTRPA